MNHSSNTEQSVDLFISESAGIRLRSLLLVANVYFFWFPFDFQEIQKSRGSEQKATSGWNKQCRRRKKGIARLFLVAHHFALKQHLARTHYILCPVMFMLGTTTETKQLCFYGQLIKTKQYSNESMTAIWKRYLLLFLSLVRLCCMEWLIPETR